VAGDRPREIFYRMLTRAYRIWYYVAGMCQAGSLRRGRRPAERGNRTMSFTKIDNEILSFITAHRITGRPLRVFLAILRETSGFHRHEASISNNRLASLSGLHKNHVYNAVKWLREANMITTSGRSEDLKYSIQPDTSKWKIPKTVLQPKTVVTTTENGNDYINPKKPLKKEESIYSRIFRHWNSKPALTAHRGLNGNVRERVVRAVNGRLREGYSEEDIVRAIDSYDFVVASDGHFFSYKWTLWDFLRRGFHKFTPEAGPETNFLRRREEAVENPEIWSD